jgi:uncharacterized protein (TIGR03083 family)
VSFLAHDDGVSTTPTTTDGLDALRASVQRLRRLVEPLDDAALAAPAYPSDWTVADVLSHIGSGAVIMQQRLEHGLAGTEMPDSFAPSVWDTWNSKSPRAQADDALAVDAELLERLEAVTDDERARFAFSMGPMRFDFEGFVALRVNEHAFHTWDIEVVADPAAGLPPESTAVVIDNLDLIARFTAKPTGDTAAITIRTTAPERDFTLELTPDRAALSPGTTGSSPQLALPAEAFARLVYGRLDPDHTPAVQGDAETLDALRRTFPGP